MATTPVYYQDPDIGARVREYFHLDMIEELHDDAGEARAELDMFPENVRKTWPPWLKWQFKKYIKLLEKLEVMRLEAPMEGKEDTKPVKVLTQVINQLTERSGIMYHEGSRFTIGGPGAHPDDIMQLLRDAGLHHRPQGIDQDTHMSLIWASEAYQASLLKMSGDAYSSHHAKDWNSWVLLASTTASARSRGLIRRYEPGPNDYRENPNAIEIPKKLNKQARETYQQGHFPRDYVIESLLKNFESDALDGVMEPIRLAGNKEIVDEGGSFDEESGWSSSLELLHKNRMVKIWENGVFPLVPVHPAYKTPGLSQADAGRFLPALFSENSWKGPNIASGAVAAQNVAA